MKKFVVIAGLAAMALLLGMAGTAVRSDQAQAKPDEVLTINPTVCYSSTRYLDWDDDGDYGTADDDAGDFALARAACFPVAWGGTGLSNATQLQHLANILEGDIADDVDIEPDTFADLAAKSGNQLNENTGALWVLAFVTNDDNATLDADEGNFDSSGTSSVDCSGVGSDIDDEDCDADGTKGDGVIVDLLMGDAGTADRCDDCELVVFQDGVDLTVEYSVVGDPDSISVIAYPSATILEGLSGSDCGDLAVADFDDEIEGLSVTGLLATVTDDDGVELVGASVDWESDDEDVVNVAEPTTPSVVTDSGTFALNLVCGDETGTATVTAYAMDIDVDDNGDPYWVEAVPDDDIDDVDDADVDITVVGEPADMTITASPAAITCDGVASSTVTASLVDADGNPVVDDTNVRFEVVALGIADPIVAQTVDGSASSTITPLSGAAAGVAVIISAADGDLEESIRIDCLAPAPTVAPPPPVAPPPTVVPPPTGSGGCLP